MKRKKEYLTYYIPYMCSEKNEKIIIILTLSNTVSVHARDMLPTEVYSHPGQPVAFHIYTIPFTVIY